MSNTQLAHLLSNAGPVVLFEEVMGCGVHGVRVGVLSCGGCLARQGANCFAAYDGVHGSGSRLGGIGGSLYASRALDVRVEDPDSFNAGVFRHAVADLPEGREGNARKPGQAVHFCVPKTLELLLYI